MRVHSTKEKQEVTGDGWVVTHVEAFRFFTEHAPPRPHGFLDQVRIDARSWKVWGFWAAGLAGLAAGLVTPWWWLAVVPGLWAWVSYFRLCRLTVRSFRDDVVRVGTVNALGSSHPLAWSMTVSTAFLGDGRSITATVPKQPTQDFLAGGGLAEVLLLCDPQSRYGRVLGVRALRHYESGA